MNSVATRKLLGKYELGSREYYYNFSAISKKFSNEECDKVASALLFRYAKITKIWSIEKNSEWMARVYFSAKMILSATVRVSSLKFSEDCNLRISQPYLRYYSVLSLLRAIVYMVPEVEWNSGDLLHISHNKAIEIASSHISCYNKEIGSQLKERFNLLKAQRELISYRTPTMADYYARSAGDVADLCRLLSEIAQFSSEILEASVAKNSLPSSWSINHECIDLVSTTKIGNYEFSDAEDAWRMNHLSRKHPKLVNIWHSMTEGHTEDFIGAWRSDNDREGQFDPDMDTQVIFDIP